ncbi:hypothetical protein [Mycolicibacterium llatzerense]|uniref:hypothetical protein n=1 Tax=Mycolicibacterium llatzerense TaxID=280871 RepID=UPI0008DC995D|nr:hypothetical protein [Mycolicibacterium llatzerense]
MANVAAYEASAADWDQLRRFAQRVAKETRQPLQAPIAYTTKTHIDVPVTVSAPGFAGLLGRRVDTTRREERTQDVVVVGRHWLLERRHHHIERNTRGKDYTNQETTHEQHYYVLLPDGSMKHVCLWEEELVYTSHGRTTFRPGEKSHLCNDLNSDFDLRIFDYASHYHEHGTHGRGTKTWGDREPGRKLLVHAKGIGLSKTLKRLLPETARPRDSTPPRRTTPESKPAVPRSSAPPSRLRGSLVNRPAGP